jgi:hypothetical protein
MTDKRISYGFPLLTLLVGLLVFATPFVLSTQTVTSLVKEDSVPEYLGSLFFFLASLTFFALFLTSKTGFYFWRIHTRWNPIYLGLAMLLFFGAGEEISWGQRLLGYGTPEALDDNIQEETTLHNLPLFDPTNEDSLVNMNRMFIYFWFGFGVVIPCLALLHQPSRQWLVKTGVPIAPILLGLQFLLFYILSKFFGPLGVDEPEYDGRLVELREMIHALIFWLIALTLWLELRHQRQKATSQTVD